jgi:transposase
MRPALTITYPLTKKELSDLVRKAKDGRVRQRLMAMKFIAQGLTIPQVAARMDIAERPLRKWLYRFNAQGPEGLKDAYRSGQPPKLDNEAADCFKSRIRQGVTQADNVCSLRARDIQQILKREFAASYSLGGTYFLLHRLDFSCLCPRPRHPQADADAQEAFKKTPSRGHQAVKKAIP